MKRNIYKFSLITLIGVGSLNASAKTDVITGDWDDDWGGNPGNVDVNFKLTPVAAFTDLHLVLSVKDSSARIFWTAEEGILPDDEGWTEYTAPLELTEDSVISYYAEASGVKSDIFTYKFVYADHQVADPVITTDEEGQLLTMTCATTGAQIRYTTDGSEPTADSPLYTEPVVIDSYIYRACAFADGLFPSQAVECAMTGVALTVVTPNAAFENKALALSCSTSRATIFYTLDPDATVDATDAWTEYTAPLELTENCIVRFFARRDGFNDSDIQSFSFVYSNYRAADPTIERDEAGTHIVMATTTEGGVIRYTTDGSEPTEQSPVYTEPILIECNGTFMAKTFADGMFDSLANRYVISNMAVPDPFVNFTLKRFALTCLDPNAEIWYTTDPEATVENMEAWTRYEASFALTENCTLHFFARRENFNDSDLESLAVVLADYQLVAPSIERNAQGTHLVMTASAQGPQLGLIPDDDSEPVLAAPQIRYTTDGSEPTPESALYEAPVRIQEGTTYRARVFDENWLDSEVSEYIIGSDKLSAPAGRFEDYALTLVSPDDDVRIWYTTDPELSVDDIDSWILYEAPLALGDDCTYRFFAGDDDANASDVQTFVFQRSDYMAAAPTVERDDDGLYVVMETATKGGEIRFTTDGSDPTEESMLYTGPLLIAGNATYRAKTFAQGLYDSEITDFVVSNMATPVAYANFENKVLTLTCADPEAAIWYTNDDDATPEEDEAWTLYEGPVALTENCFVHFFTRRENYNDSDIETFVFLRANYMTAVAAIERSDDGNSISMSCETEGAAIYYTTDGSEPTVESEVYTEPVYLIGNCTFKAIAVADGLFESAMSEYTVSNMTLADPYAVYENDLLTLSIWDTEASIWYTLDPDADVADLDAWTLYTEPIAPEGNCTVRFFARRDNFLDSQVMTYEVSGVSGINAAEVSCLKVSKEGGEVVVYADVPVRVAVYTLNGQLVRIADLAAGRNVLDGLTRGAYIIAGTKVIL